MTKDELEQSIYARTRRYVDDDVMDAVLDLLAASRRAALEEAGAFMDARADEFAACGNHTSDTMAMIYRSEANAIRVLANGDKQ
ncbi:hypothetical protein FVF58_09300 [Paraburkholderia panacisoli]|uniref:Uncharacterized protein n=1 Tax=Paraburkholderia panacisoli TaxID=2603818 RepID=A0A5B0HD58_9BURK|nr:hypothetical protein [Paraburkholderia panacisoli]KAA1012980.1 hypothetical protein FVF58_09300 [Paraburkholderia panacisoli]